MGTQNQEGIIFKRSTIFGQPAIFPTVLDWNGIKIYAYIKRKQTNSTAIIIGTFNISGEIQTYCIHKNCSMYILIEDMLCTVKRIGDETSTHFDLRKYMQGIKEDLRIF
jgi:hypothetical protein